MGMLNNSQNFVVPGGGSQGGGRASRGVLALVAGLMGRRAAQEDAIFRSNLDVATYGRKKSIDTEAHQEKTDITLGAKKEEISHKDASGAATKIYTQREGLKTSRRHIKEVNKIVNKPDFSPNIAEINERGGLKLQKTGQKVRAKDAADTQTPPDNNTPNNPNTGVSGGNSGTGTKRTRKKKTSPIADGNPVGGPWV